MRSLQTETNQPTWIATNGGDDNIDDDDGKKRINKNGLRTRLSWIDDEVYDESLLLVFFMLNYFA